MWVIPQVDVQPSDLVSSNVPEDDHTEWASGQTVAVGDYRMSLTTHSVYRCLIAHTTTESGDTGDPDETIAALADPLITDPATVYWQYMHPTNRWKMFAGDKPSQQTVQTGGIEVTIAFSEIFDGLGVFKVDNCSEVIVTINAEDYGEVYSETHSLSNVSNITDAWSYWFTPVTPLTYFVLTDLPPYLSGEVTLEFVGEGAVAVGQVCFGLTREIGYVRLGETGMETLDFSSVDLDEFGNLTTTVRAATTIHYFEVVTSAESMASVLALMEELRGGKSAIFLGDTQLLKASVTYGYVRAFRPSFIEGDSVVSRMQTQGKV